MTPAEFSAAIAALGLSQLAAAEVLEVDPRTVRRWVAGDRDIPGPVRVALRLMIARPIISTTCGTTALPRARSRSTRAGTP